MKNNIEDEPMEVVETKDEEGPSCESGEELTLTDNFRLLRNKGNIQYVIMVNYVPTGIAMDRDEARKILWRLARRFSAQETPYYRTYLEPLDKDSINVLGERRNLFFHCTKILYRIEVVETTELVIPQEEKSDEKPKKE